MPTTWAALGAALLLVPPPGPGGGRAGPPGHGDGRALRLGRRSLQVVAALACACGCLGLLGWPAGGVAALCAAPAAAVLVRRLEARASARVDLSGLALALDLVAVALRCGQPVPDAIRLGAPAAAGLADRLGRVAGLLELGAAPQEAWAVLGDQPALAALAATATRSAASGSRLAAAFEQRARELRADAAAAATGRAERVGVLVAAPLGLCFLPAFVCLGVAPVVIGVAAGVLR